MLISLRVVATCFTDIFDRHRHQQQKIHAASVQSPTHHSPSKSLGSPYGGRPARSLSAETIPRSVLRDQPPPLIHPSHPYLASQHMRPDIASPSHGPTGMSLQPCISPMQSMVPGMSLPEYTPLTQPMYAPDMHHSNATNSPMNPSIVMPASPNTAAGVFDINAKWDHLFQGGGIFEMSSIFGVDSEFGNLTPPDLSVCSSTIHF